MDDATLIEYWNEVSDGLRRYLLSWLSIQLIDDVLQETYIRAHRAKSTLPSDMPLPAFRAWVYTTGRNEALRYFRRMKVRRADSLEGDHTPSQPDKRPPVALAPRDEVFATTTSIDQHADAADSSSYSALVYRACECRFLTPDEAAILIARFDAAHEKLRDICVRLEIAPTVGAMRFMRGIRNLRVYMFQREMHLLGGIRDVMLAMEEALVRRVNPLTALEAIEFRQNVLEPSTDSVDRKMRLTEKLRDACAKVAEQLGRTS